VRISLRARSIGRSMICSRSDPGLTSTRSFCSLATTAQRASMDVATMGEIPPWCPAAPLPRPAHLQLSELFLWPPWLYGPREHQLVVRVQHHTDFCGGASCSQPVRHRVRLMCLTGLPDLREV